MLIADDDRDSREMYALFLNMHGYAVAVEDSAYPDKVSSGSQACK